MQPEQVIYRDEAIARMRGLAEKGWAEHQEKKRASGEASATAPEA